MSGMKRNVVLALAVAAAVAAPGAFATNGYFSHGYGVKASGMAGAGVAYPQDSLAAATNPAGMVMVGARKDIGVQLFNPSPRSQNSQGGMLTAGKNESDGDFFFVPEGGFNTMLDANTSVGVSIYGNGGMNTEYKTNTFLGLGAGTSPLGVDLAQLIIAPTWSKKLSKDSAFGASLLLGYQRFKATGLEAFGGNSTDSTKLTNNGYDSATGTGVRIGWTGNVSPTVTLGATYSSKISMSKFDKYKGLFAEQGDFDIPANFAVGAAFKVNPKTNVALDVLKIEYGSVKSIANPLDAAPSGATMLGNNEGAGFGWKDQTVVKLGFDYKHSNEWTLRAGWNHGSSPIPDSQLLFNIIAPAVVEDHLTLGATMHTGKSSEVNFTYMHAFEGKQTGPVLSAFGGGTSELKMSQNALSVGWGWGF